MQYTLLNFKGN